MVEVEWEVFFIFSEEIKKIAIVTCILKYRIAVVYSRHDMVKALGEKEPDRSGHEVTRAYR